MKKNKRMRIPIAGLVVILFGLTTVLIFSIRDQPDPGKKPEISTRQKEEKDENTESIRQHTEESTFQNSINIYGTGHLYYLDPEGDQNFQRRLTQFVTGQSIKAESAEVLEYCMDDRDKETEPAQFFLELDDKSHTIVRVTFEKITGNYQFDLYDGALPDDYNKDNTSGEESTEKEMPEVMDDEAVPKSRLTITDPEGDLKAVAKMKQLKKKLKKFLRSEGEGRRNFYVNSVTVTDDGYVALLCFETVRQDGRNVEVSYDGEYHFRFV